MAMQRTVNAEDAGSSPTPAANSTLIVDEPNNSTATNPNNSNKPQLGRPPSRRHRKAVLAHLRSGQATTVDKGWLMEQLLIVYGAHGIRAQDKLRAVELMAKLSGYTGKEAEPEDEKAAIQALMAEMENANP